MAAAPVDFFSLTPYQQQAYLNGDPDYLAAGPPQPTRQQAQTAEVTRLAAADQFATIPFGTSLETVFTLETYLAQWAAGAITSPASLEGADPVTEAQKIALERCAVIPTPDCINRFSLAQQYGQQVAAAISASAAAVARPAAVTAAPPPAAPAAVPVVPPSGPGSAAAPPAAAAAAIAPLPAVARSSAPGAELRAVTPKFILGDAGGAVSAAGDTAALASAAVTFGISIVADILANLFLGLFGGSDTKQLAKAVDQLRTAVAQGLDEVSRFAWQIANGLGALWKAIANIWDNFLDAIWSALKGLWNLLWCVVSEILPRIINILRDLRKWLDVIYVKYLLPAMRYLQRARLVLAILRALHVGFAAKLDKILGQIQGALFGPFRWLLVVLNGYGSWINVLVTNRYVLQRPVFLRSMYAYQADWINLWWTAQTSPVAAAALGTGAGAAATSHYAQVVAQQNLYLTTGTGPMAADVAQAETMTAAAIAGIV